MQYEEFLQPFHGDSRRHDQYEGSQAETLEAADRWSDYFSDTLYDLLDGNLIPLKPRDSASKLIDYIRWTEHDLTSVQKSVLQVKSERSASLANRLNFHELNRSFTLHWQMLATGESFKDAAASRAEKTYTQNCLALSAMEVLKRREAIPVNEYYSQDEQSKQLSLKRQTYEGILTEFDTAIILLEIIKDEPDLFVLPSPSLFEHGESRGLNSDFLLIDRGQNEIVGVQTKSNVNEYDLRRYDSERVVLVSGSTDFDNVSLRKGRLRDVKATAGLVSAAHLLHMPTNRNKLKNGALPLQDNRAILQAKLYAKQVVAENTRHSIRISKDRIGDRLTRALYKTRESNSL